VLATLQFGAESGVIACAALGCSRINPDGNVRSTAIAGGAMRCPEPTAGVTGPCGVIL